MSLSVALCTYNGARFLEEQLQSITIQTRPPDEIVICDDHSQDATVEVAEYWASDTSFPVKIHCNATNIGSTKNFEKAIELCEGDIIVLCDQDDVWHQDKLEKLEMALVAAPSAGLVYSDAEAVDAELKPLNLRIWDHFGFDVRRRRMVMQGNAFEALLEQNFITGATMAFRASYKPLILPFPTGITAIHDGWIALLIAAVADITFVSEPLILYRQHPHQQLGVRQQQTVSVVQTPRLVEQKSKHYQAHLKQMYALRERLQSHRQRYGSDRVAARLAEMEHQIEHLQARTELPSPRLRRLRPILRELLSGRYHRYSSGFRSVVADLLRLV